MKREPKIGDYLYATCAGSDYGKVLAVGKDGNGIPCIDIEVNNPDDLISFSDESNALTTIQLPAGVKIVLKDVQYKLLDLDWAYGIECNTPADNCYRCTKSFLLQTEPTP